MANLLALDQATRVSGYAIFNEEGKLLKYGKIVMADSDDIGKRLNKTRQSVEQLLVEWNIGEVVMEDIQLQENVQTFKALAEVFGVLYELFISKGLPVEAVLASSWKSTLGVKGKDRAAQKRNAQQWVVDNYSIKPTQDECDAICIGEHYLRTKQNIFDWSF